MRRFPSGGAGLASRLGADNIAHQALSESPDEHRSEFRGRSGGIRKEEKETPEPKETASQIEEGVEDGEGMMDRLSRMEERQMRIEELLVGLTKGLSAKQDRGNDDETA